MARFAVRTLLAAGLAALALAVGAPGPAGSTSAPPDEVRLDDVNPGVMQERMVGMARDVAEASGGFLGLGSKISEEEQAVLDDIERTLTDD